MFKGLLHVKETNHKLIKKYEKSGGDHDLFSWQEYYMIIECAGCEAVSFVEVYSDSEMYNINEHGHQEWESEKKIYPYYLEKGQVLENIKLVPKKIRKIYDEAIGALKSNLPLLAAAGLRAVIESICNDQKIPNENVKLIDKIDLLAKEGIISTREAKRLHPIRFLGNDAIHEIKTPAKNQLYILLNVVNNLMFNLFISDKVLDEGNPPTP